MLHHSWSQQRPSGPSCYMPVITQACSCPLDLLLRGTLIYITDIVASRSTRLWFFFFRATCVVLWLNHYSTKAFFGGGKWIWSDLYLMIKERRGRKGGSVEGPRGQEFFLCILQHWLKKTKWNVTSLLPHVHHNRSGKDPEQVKQGQIIPACLTAVIFFPSIVCRQQDSLKKESLPPLKFLEGEVIWAKFNRRPWWPCEVIVDPAQGIYHRVKGGSGALLTCCDTWH